MEYSYFVITYIIFSFILILTYIINYAVKSTEGIIYTILIYISTISSCLSPLVVGIIRIYRTDFIRRFFSKCNSRDPNNDQLINNKEHSEEGGRMFNMEQRILEKLIIKYFTAISYVLGTSKYTEE
jgi:hypothetical protein